MLSKIWGWLTGKVAVLEEVKPVVKDGETIVADLMEVINDLKGKRFGEVVDDAKKIADDVKVFAAEVEKVVAILKAQQTVQQ